MFTRSLRKRLKKQKLITPEQFLSFLQRQARRIASIHVNLSQTSDGRMASAMYQDGLLHALQDVLTSTTLGIKKKEDFEIDYREAEHRLTQMLRQHDAIEIAYWSGRFEVIRRFVKRTKGPIPAYFHPYRARPLTKLIKGKTF